MWKCENCGREFQRVNQDHYCGKMESIDEYIFEQREEAIPILQKIRETILTAAPAASERIAWRMPTFWQGENLIHFALFKKHIGIYPGEEAILAFAEKLQAYKTTKGAIQLPLCEDIPYDLIREITRWRVLTVEGRDKK